MVVTLKKGRLVEGPDCSRRKLEFLLKYRKFKIAIIHPSRRSARLLNLEVWFLGQRLRLQI